MKVKLILLCTLLALSFKGICQTCIQPGALMSVRNLTTEKYDYLVFKFLKPHPDKGIVSGAKADLFPDQLKKRNTYHRIAFQNVAYFCYNKLDVAMPTKRILDFKVEQNTDNMVSYVFALAEGVKIKSHYVYSSHGFHIVKVRIE
jgi:hypothetical protein